VLQKNGGHMENTVEALLAFVEPNNAHSSSLATPPLPSHPPHQNSYGHHTPAPPTGGHFGTPTATATTGGGTPMRIAIATATPIALPPVNHINNPYAAAASSTSSTVGDASFYGHQSYNGSMPVSYPNTMTSQSLQYASQQVSSSSTPMHHTPVSSSVPPSVANASSSEGAMPSAATSTSPKGAFPLADDFLRPPSFFKVC
jgi:hypothetical protein